jgi:hypothetical protein
MFTIVRGANGLEIGKIIGEGPDVWRMKEEVKSLGVVFALLTGDVGRPTCRPGNSASTKPT